MPEERSMLFACWAAKGGAGVTVTSCALAVVLARRYPGGALLVDLGGDATAVLGHLGEGPEADGGGVVPWLVEVEAAAVAGRSTGSSRPPEHRIGPQLHIVPRGGGPLPLTCRSCEPLNVLGGEARAVVVDCGTVEGAADPHAPPWPAALVAAATHSLLVTRRCYLGLRRAVRAALRPSGIVVVSEPGRALGTADVASAVGAPVVADVPYDPAVARAVDAGLLARRLPSSLARAVGVLAP